MKYKNKFQGSFKSNLESYTSYMLKKNGIKYFYEGLSIPLIDSFEYKSDCYGKFGKKFKKLSNKVRATVYVPDFTNCDNLDELKWIIEVKGMFTSEAKLKWKLLKKYLNQYNPEVVLMMPRNRRQVERCIEIINSL